MQDRQVFVNEFDVYGPPGAPSVRNARKEISQALAALDRALPYGNAPQVLIVPLKDARASLERAILSLMCAVGQARTHAQALARADAGEMGASDRH